MIEKVATLTLRKKRSAERGASIAFDDPPT